MPISIDSELCNWVKEEYKNVSEFVSSLIKEEYNNRSNPIPKIKKLQELDYNTQEKLDFNYDKLLKVLEEGNKKEREEAELLIKDKEEKENKEIKENEQRIEGLRKLPMWESFIEKYIDMDYEEVGKWYEENILSKDLELHRIVGGIGYLKKLFEKFTKEQLMGGIIL